MVENPWVKWDDTAFDYFCPPDPVFDDETSAAGRCCVECRHFKGVSRWQGLCGVDGLKIDRREAEEPFEEGCECPDFEE